MTDIKLIPLKDEHLPYLWNILQTYENYFDDTVKMNTLQDFYKWMKENIVEGLVGIRDKEILGCGYLESIENNMGCISLFSKRHSIYLLKMIEFLKDALLYFFVKYNLVFIYAIVRYNNRAIIRLLKGLGFGGMQNLPKHEKVNGEFIDCKLFGLLKENLR
jgi:L-amino acid N-acyltransferase YncA